MGVEPGAELYDFNEPSPTGKAGFGKWQNPKSPYDCFIEDQGIPIHRDIGVHKVQDLPMAPWKRLGGRGTAIQLLGTEHLWGMYVVEVPGAGALNAERHLYEETYYVVEGAAPPRCGTRARAGNRPSSGVRARSSASR